MIVIGPSKLTRLKIYPYILFPIYSFTMRPSSYSSLDLGLNVPKYSNVFYVRIILKQVSQEYGLEAFSVILSSTS